MSNFSVDRQAILVLGMHRSGTSALTRVINLLGFGLPRALIPPSQYNERGFWETQVLADFHDRVLESAGSYWHDWSKFNSDWHGSPVSSPFREELKRIIDSEFGMNDAFVIKDPRICRFVPLWVDTLQSLQIQPYAVIPIRHPLEVVHSLRERDRFTDQKSLLLWLRHVLDAEGSSRHLPRAFCTYESLLSDWHGTMKRMGMQMGVVWPRLSMDSRIEIGDFLSSKIRHHVFASQDLNAEKGIGEWIRETYHLLDGLYTDPNDAIAQQRLDKIREDFDSGCATFGVAMRREEREAERQCDKALELDATVRERTAEAARLENDLAEARRLIAELDTAVREQAAEAVRLESDLAEAQQCAEDSLAALQERMVEAARLRDDLESARQQSIALTQEIDEIRKSISWRMTAPVRTIGFQFPWLDRQIHQAPEWMERLKSFRWRRENQHTGSRALDPGVKSSRPRPSAPVDPYAAWLRVNHWNPRSESELYRRLAMHYSRLPKISVIMPIYNPPIRFLTRAIQSLRCQVYSHWELCIADDASSDERVKPYLEELAQDARIVVCFREKNGHISAATNSAAALATGDFILLMDQDDELAVNALAEVALSVADHPETDLLYSDCDKIDAEGNRYDPHFKPDWSPELLLSYMYAGQVLVVRRSLFEQVGGMRQGFEGSQDHDFALRAGEVARQVTHIPAVLYHWRCFRGSTAFSGHEKPYSFEAGLKAVQSALDRRGSQGQAYQPDWAKRNGNGIYHIRFPDTGPSVTLIIPTHNRTDLLRQCLNSLRRTTYRDYQIMVVDNESDQVEAQRYLQQLDHEVIHIPNQHGKGFSFSYVMNEAVRRTKTDYVLFLNDDTEVITPEWLSSMMGYAELSGVGAVGALLRYKDGKVQHAGVVHGMDGLCDHAFKLTRRGDNGYLSYIAMARDCAAVTAACMLTPRRLFLEMGGFDTDQFAVAYNDPDYCYRLRDRGYRVVYTPDAELFHFEGQTRGFSDKPREIAAYRKRFKAFEDPYLNPNLSRENPCFEITPRRVRRDFDQALRVAMFTHNLNWEGAPKQMQEIAGFLHRHSTIKPLIFSPKDGPLRGLYEKMGIKVRVFAHPLIKHHTLPGYLEAIGEIGALLADEAVDVVYANTLHGFVAVDAAREAQLPCLWAIHESEGWRHYFDFVPPTLRSRPIECFSYPYRVVFVAKQTRQIYRELDWYHNFTVIPNGLEPGSVDLPSEAEKRAARRAVGLGEGDIGVLSVGTVCERKRQLDLVEAIARLHEDVFKSREVHFFIVGDRENEYSSRMHAAMETLSPERRKRLTVLPETPNVVDFYHACDIFVLTSGMESYPRVILEAMSAGLAILTTPVNGVVEQVREGINADYFPVGDIRQLTARLTALIQDSQRRENYRVASPVVLQGLTDYEEMGGSYARLFHEAALASVPDA
ncbi:MAG: glycosyltransferase [Candidatus Contendobacter sp.]|nr:MAG: glycosyltransferase [Candidatus Contendobacter sp.]